MKSEVFAQTGFITPLLMKLILTTHYDYCLILRGHTQLHHWSSYQFERCNLQCNCKCWIHFWRA